jgi:SAC3/GANP family
MEHVAWMLRRQVCARSKRDAIATPSKCRCETVNSRLDSGMAPPCPVELMRWDGVVRRARRLRESLTASGAPPAVCRDVYELSADVCAAGRNMAELLKCLQVLCSSIYPALVVNKDFTQCEKQPGGVAELPEPHQHESKGSNRGDDSSCSCQRELQRRIDVSAALLAYFCCVPRHPVVIELAKQLRAAARTPLAVPYCASCVGGSSSSNDGVTAAAAQQQRPLVTGTVSDERQGKLRSVPCQLQLQQKPRLLLLGADDYQLAVRACSAVLADDWLTFIACIRTRPPHLLHCVLEQGLLRVRVRAVHVMATSYRMLPTDTLRRWLALDNPAALQGHLGGRADDKEAVHTHHSDLKRVLEAAANEGCRGARVAVEQCHAAGAAGVPVTLTFRA